MARQTRARQTTARRVRNKLIEITVSIVFLLIMINLVLPWASQYLVEAFTR